MKRTGLLTVQHHLEIVWLAIFQHDIDAKHNAIQAYVDRKTHNRPVNMDLNIIEAAWHDPKKSSEWASRSLEKKY